MADWPDSDNSETVFTIIKGSSGRLSVARTDVSWQNQLARMHPIRLELGKTASKVPHDITHDTFASTVGCKVLPQVDDPSQLALVLSVRH